jgi:hypothetical protein
MTTSPFKRYPRTWCPDCDTRTFVKDIDKMGVCWDCYQKAQEQAEKDAENRSWRGFSDEERALNG